MLYKFDTKVQYLKYKVLREVARHAWDDTLLDNLLEIPKTIVPGNTPTMRCCVYKERAILGERVKIAMGGDKSNPNVIEVIETACDECPMGGYEVTNACRGCLAHRCMDACRFGAITFDQNHVAHIDKTKCKECGACSRVCPYTAIISRKRPCENACKIKAIKMNENKARSRLDQRRAPIYEALERFRQMRVVPFDVPGHKRGRGNPELTAFLGQQCVGVDVNSMKPLDNLCHPVSVIREAEELAADAFGAAHAFLMVGGTTSSVQSMVLTACKRGDEIILPRNVHRSVLNALVLCGAVPVYVNPEVDKRLGISLGMKREQVAKAIKEHPNAVAVLVNNPTYYGICSDLRAIVKMAHDAGMLCLADEAHGTHFYFGGGLPVSAMAAGADMASVSMHKSGGSLTQSSLLLIGPNVHPGYVRQIINLTQTTSGSYLLMSSLDISRRNLALRGRQVFHQVADIAEYAREEINAVGGYYAFGKELCNGDSVFDFDTTKLSVHTLDIGLAGIEVYDILRDEYDIQIEFGDIGNILAYLSIGDRPQEVERLVSALAEIKRRYRTDGSGLLSQEYIDPVVAASPQEAFYAPKKSLPLRETEGMVCSEFVMCYPPGIPILAPGERITKEILNYIEYAKAKGCSMTGPEDPEILHLNVLA